MSKKLFVGSLAWATTDDALRAAFEPFGPLVSANVITERDSGRSKGFGFVEFENDDDADKAIAEMNGKELDGRPITVDHARPKEEAA